MQKPREVREKCASLEREAFQEVRELVQRPGVRCILGGTIICGPLWLIVRPVRRQIWVDGSGTALWTI